MDSTVSKISDAAGAILADTVTDFAGALRDVPDELADKVRQQQEDVADTFRHAQVNEDLLRSRVC